MTTASSLAERVAVLETLARIPHAEPERVTSELQTLESWNKKRRAALEKRGSFRLDFLPNGIACPECGRELVDTYPDVGILTSIRERSISCPACEFTGYRVA